MRYLIECQAFQWCHSMYHAIRTTTPIFRCYCGFALRRCALAVGMPRARLPLQWHYSGTVGWHCTPAGSSAGRCRYDTRVSLLSVCLCACSGDHRPEFL